MTNRKYSCTQQELYSAAEIGWQSATQHLAKFTDFKPKYDATFIASKMTELNNAKLLPSEDERNSKSAILRIKLNDANRIALNKYQDLKSHIADVFAPQLHNQNFIAAGQNHFDKAIGRNWDSTRALLDLATHYIGSNIAILTTNQNMPATFQADFEAISNDFVQLHTEFIDSEESATIGTEDKIIMNNKIFDELRKLFRDGQKIFRYNDAIRKQFIFSDVLYLLSGAGTAGVRGQITNGANGQPISNAVVSVVETGETNSSTDNGSYQISPMAAGIYQLKVNAPGYADVLIPGHQVLTGTISTFNIKMMPAV